MWGTACVRSVTAGVPPWAILSGCERLTSGSKRLEPLIQQFHHMPLEQVPDVIQLDGIWITITEQGEVVVLDQRDRAQKLRHGKKMVILVALGLQSREWKRETRNCMLIAALIIGTLQTRTPCSASPLSIDDTRKLTVRDVLQPG